MGATLLRVAVGSVSCLAALRVVGLWAQYAAALLRKVPGT